MSRSIVAITLATLLTGGATSVFAQEPVPEIPPEQRVRTLPRQKLSGPRFGFTTFTGDVAEHRQSRGLEPIMSQFGWQFETQIVSTTDGSQALMEWVFLVGGVEQDEINLSLAWLAGYRLYNGVEFGVGPSVSANKDEPGDVHTSMVVASGVTIPFGDLRVPFNVAGALAEGGPRITTLIGWIIG